MSFFESITDRRSARTVASSLLSSNTGYMRRISKPLLYAESIKPKSRITVSRKSSYLPMARAFIREGICSEFEISDILANYKNLLSKLKDNIFAMSDIEVFQSDLSRVILGHSPRLSSMDEMISHISFGLSGSGDDNFDFDFFKSHIENIDEFQEREKQKKISPFIKVILRETDDIILFEKPSLTVLKGTPEADIVLNDNERYEFLTSGKGRNRRKSEAETQTTEILYKAKCVNTDIIKKIDAGAYVSNYDMYDTYENIEKVTKSVDFDGNEKLEITTYKIQDLERFEEVGKTHRFNLSVMLMQRLLAGNVYREKQKRFRNMYLPDPLSLDVKYLYRLEILWKYRTIELGKSVSCMCWCPNDGDILAVAYGIFFINLGQDKQNGYVAIWNIKNPVNPERKIKFNSPVVCVEFSKYTPQLLAVGMYDGTVEIRDITNEFNSLIGTNHDNEISGSEPILSIKWIVKGQQNTKEKAQFLLVVSTDGSIVRYQLGSGLHLLGFLQIKLNRVELEVEGLLINRNTEFIEANRHPQIFDLVIHPVKSDEFYALTDEGCYYRCSLNYPQQHLDIFQLHDGCVFCMEWSPFSPKVFLTCGSDWYIRIWITGISEPIISLTSGSGPVNCAYWSPTHSFIIVAVLSSTIEIWDIRRSLLKPVSSHDFKKELNVSFTKAKFSKCGRSIAIGDTEGNIMLASFEDMPFAPHFQYNELEEALYKATMAYPDLTDRIQNLGYFGYENDRIKSQANE